MDAINYYGLYSSDGNAYGKRYSVTVNKSGVATFGFLAIFPLNDYNNNTYLPIYRLRLVGRSCRSLRPVRVTPTTRCHCKVHKTTVPKLITSLYLYIHIITIICLVRFGPLKIIYILLPISPYPAYTLTTAIILKRPQFNNIMNV